MTECRNLTDKEVAQFRELVHGFDPDLVNQLAEVCQDPEYCPFCESRTRTWPDLVVKVCRTVTDQDLWNVFFPPIEEG